MNRRKAKKAVKKKWNIKKWIGNISPREVDAAYSKFHAYMKAALIEAIDRAILYGEEEKFASHEKPIGIINVNGKNYFCQKGGFIKMTVEEKACCLRIVDHYGVTNQELKTIEECAELISALMHNARGRATADDIIDEIADVMIMTQQLSIIYGQRKVDNRIREKLDRQLDRIRNERTV